MTKDEHRSTVRVLSILLALSNTPDGLTLAELSQQLSAPKSSLFTIIHTMANQNFASYNEVTQKYSIGLNAYLTGVAYMETHNIFERFQEEMKSIVNQCSEICQLAFLTILRFSILRKSIPQNQSACHLLSGNAFLHTAPALENLCYANVQKRIWKFSSPIL